MSTELRDSTVVWRPNGGGLNGSGTAHGRGAAIHVQRMAIQTSKRTEIHDLTEHVQAVVREARVTAGLVTLSTMHTTTAVFVNEPQSALLEDVQQLLEHLVPRGADWKHNDPRYSDCDRSNADAHLRAIMLGHSVTLQVADGALTMGQWQRILMAEFDGPRKRNLVLQVLAAA